MTYFGRRLFVRSPNGQNLVQNQLHFGAVCSKRFRIFNTGARLYVFLLIVGVKLEKKNGKPDVLKLQSR